MPQRNIRDSAKIRTTRKLKQHLPRQPRLDQFLSKIRQSLGFLPEPPEMDKDRRICNQSHDDQGGGWGDFISIWNLSNSASLKSGKAATAAKTRSKSNAMERT